MLCFNSLQTGKCIASKLLGKPCVAMDYGFNSLQTGKCIASEKVQPHYRPSRYLCFNSLQTGKCIASKRTMLYNNIGTAFQFPSNGKVYSKLVMDVVEQHYKSFNSLQTGKCIARVRWHGKCVERRKSFNSLQTGKCIARNRDGIVQIPKDIFVSIPFKRESV